MTKASQKRQAKAVKGAMASPLKLQRRARAVQHMKRSKGWNYDNFLEMLCILYSN